jgi:hypothetical protein
MLASDRRYPVRRRTSSNRVRYVSASPSSIMCTVSTREIELEGLCLAETSVEPGTIQRARSSYVQVLIVARLDEEPESDVGQIRLLRPQERPQDASIQNIVQLDDLVAPFCDDEEQPVIPRLLQGVQTDLERSRSGHHGPDMVSERITVYLGRGDGEDERDV